MPMTDVDMILNEENKSVNDNFLDANKKLDQVVENTGVNDNANADEEVVEVHDDNKGTDSNAETNSESSETEAESSAAESAEESDDEGDKADSEESDPETDDYGNDIKPSKASEQSDDDTPLYTKSDLNRLIRERLDRMKVPVNQQSGIVDAVTQAMANPESGGDNQWITDITTVVKETMKAEKAREKEESWQAEQVRAQTEFQDRFTSGMNKYKDFRQVTEKMPITDAMMLAIRDLPDIKNPAAFIYSASKKAPDKLRTIANMPSPAAQAAAIGRLEMELRGKAPSVKKNSGAPRAPTKVGGDIAKGSLPKAKSVDQLIEIEERRKFNVRR